MKQMSAGQQLMLERLEREVVGPWVLRMGVAWVLGFFVMLTSFLIVNWGI